MSDLLDEKYYQQVPDESLAERLLIAARDRIYKDFLDQMRPGPSDRILDVGVSDVINNGANVLQRCYPQQQNITACGLGTGQQFQATFPKVNYVRIEPNAGLPFEDRSFAIATANAVLEHVGSESNQASFVSELCRVAERVFISVPHKFFPIEHHTALPFVHYQKRMFELACAATGKSEWTKEENLILMTRKRLRQLAAPIGKRAAVGFTGLTLGPFSSNLFLAFSGGVAS
ncbi:class I SAM-dependent methyltransferase [Bradyrhizobium sp. USDA 3458]|uniref:class I SAM-dependent methyltransferase n=1 Tax=Bradyrhizobium sp. USDA 3458 TaxID=2591461 RepID=UPI0011426C65|nr:class I SAM-dependent methyltransferase [Bradyrhizobium sp. USDA 3458]